MHDSGALLGYTGDPEIASDALAEAFAQALARDGDLLSLEDWVWTSAFRIAAGMLKKEHGSEHALPESGYELPEPVRDLVQALSRILHLISPTNSGVVELEEIPSRTVMYSPERALSTVWLTGSRG